jgi:hypothetical protein
MHAQRERPEWGPVQAWNEAMKDVFARCFKKNHDSHEFIHESGTVANRKYTDQIRIQIIEIHGPLRLQNMEILGPTQTQNKELYGPAQTPEHGSTRTRLEFRIRNY